MNVKESKAIKMLCPIKGNTTCSGSDCMAWRYRVVPASFDKESGTKFKYNKEYGRCGLVPDTCKHVRDEE